MMRAARTIALRNHRAGIVVSFLGAAGLQNARPIASAVPHQRAFSAAAANVSQAAQSTPALSLSPDEVKEKTKKAWSHVADAYTESHLLSAAGHGHQRTFYLMSKLVVDVAGKRCEHFYGSPVMGGRGACRSRATHGVKGRRATKCAAHADRGMVNLRGGASLATATATAAVDDTLGAASTSGTVATAAAAAKMPSPECIAYSTDSAAAADGITVLDVASAGGEPALTLARALPEAAVYGTDFVPKMVELIRRRATAAGAGNLTAAMADGERLEAFADRSMNAVTCSFGLMFMPSYFQALKEFHRVLKSDGLMVATVWDKEEVPRFSLLQDLLERIDPGSRPVLDPTVLGGRNGVELKEAMYAAGFDEVLHSTYEAPASGENEDDAFEFLVMGTPFKATLHALEAHGRPHVKEEARSAFADLYANSTYIVRGGSSVDGCGGDTIDGVGGWSVPGNMAHLYCAWKA